jgi:hypothetical protein
MPEPERRPDFPVRASTLRLMKTRNILLLLAIPFANALAAPRTWTDTKGRKVEAEFVSQTANKVTVKLATGKEVTLPKLTLSEVDQEFLKTAAPAPASAPPAASTSRAAFTGPTFDSARIDKNKWKRTPLRDLKLQGLDFPSQIETEHFFIAGGPGVKPALLETNAEACERLYAHITRLVPRLMETFRDQRMTLWITANRDDMEVFGNSISSRPGGGFTALSDTVIAAAVLPDEMVSEQKFVRNTRIIRADGNESQRSVKWPSRLFFNASAIFHATTSNMKMNAGNSIGLIELGWCYFLESEICGKITTEVQFTGGDEVQGFRNGRAWPATVKTILKNGSTAKPGAVLLLQTVKARATPLETGIAFGFAHWCFRDPARARQFSSMLDSSISEGLAPDPESFAKAFGFESVAAFDAAFNAYLKSDQFK